MLDSELQSKRKQRGPSVLIFVFLILWIFWCAVFAYINYVIPAWQEEQARLLNTALEQDCGLLLDVPPYAIRPSVRPMWSDILPRTGKPVECRVWPSTGMWFCSECGEP